MVGAGGFAFELVSSMKLFQYQDTWPNEQLRNFDVFDVALNRAPPENTTLNAPWGPWLLTRSRIVPNVRQVSEELLAMKSINVVVGERRMDR